MSILGMIDDIDRLVFSRVEPSEIKPFIITLRDQAEALELRLRTLESKSQVKRLRGEIDFLKTQLDSAVQENQKLQAAQQTKEELVEHRGAFFKRKHGSGYHEAVYCPKCRNSAGSMDGFSIQYSCAPCRWIATFAPMDLAKIMNELP